MAELLTAKNRHANRVTDSGTASFFIGKPIPGNASIALLRQQHGADIDIEYIAFTGTRTQAGRATIGAPFDDNGTLKAPVTIVSTTNQIDDVGNHITAGHTPYEIVAGSQFYWYPFEDEYDLSLAVAQAQTDAATIAALEASATTAEAALQTTKTSADTAAASILAQEAAVNATIAATWGQIQKLISAPNVVDHFIYDTTLDSDPDWIHRCRWTSWENETLDTVTRGLKRKFPKRALFVVETDKVTIYDITDAAVPMWMVYNGSDFRPVFTSGMSSVSAKNGEILLGNNGVGFLARISLVEDKWSLNNPAASGLVGTIAGIDRRNDTLSAYDTTTTSGVIAHHLVNDVAATTRPSAEIDPAKQMPYPTILVGTDEGGSVINVDGTAANEQVVYDFATAEAPTNRQLTSVAFDENNRAIVSAFSGNLSTFSLDDLTSDTTSWAAIPAKVYFGTSVPALPAPADRLSAPAGRAIYVGDAVSGGLEMLVEDTAVQANGMVAYTTKDYATGLLRGDIRLAALADTVAGLIADTELVTNGSFTTDTDWTKETGWTISGGVAICGAHTGQQRLIQPIVTVAGQVYEVTYDILNYTAGGFSVEVGGGGYGTSRSANGTYTEFLTSNGDGFLRLAGDGGFLGEIDNVSVKEAVSDRSVKGNHLSIVGSLPKAAVASDAQLVATSGFSLNNYLEAAYTPDFDFGVGDFAIMGWAKFGASGSPRCVLDRAFDSGGYSGPLIQIRYDVGGAGDVRLYISDDGNTTADQVSTTSNIEDDGQFHFFCGVREGSTLRMYLRGREEANAPIVNAASSLSNPNAVLNIGRRVIGTDALSASDSLCLVRITASAPTASQIARMYNFERQWFQPGGKITLGGTSNKVNDIAYSEQACLVFVATDDGCSVFSELTGLRVDHLDTSNTSLTLGNVITSVSAVGDAYAISNDQSEVAYYEPAVALREGR